MEWENKGMNADSREYGVKDWAWWVEFTVQRAETMWSVTLLIQRTTEKEKSHSSKLNQSLTTFLTKRIKFNDLSLRQKNVLGAT